VLREAHAEQIIKSLDASGGSAFRNTHPLPQVVLTAPRQPFDVAWRANL
jgi:hypothetical protein